MFEKYNDSLTKLVTIEKDIRWDDRECYQVNVEISNFGYVDYIVKKGERLEDIARAKNISEYIIIEENEDIDDHKDVKEGQLIIIPTDYAKKMVFFIDKKRFIPLVIPAYDDKGLFEEYKYLGVRLNTMIPEEEFSKNYDDYGF
ncbi:MAG: LysM peptidoglycan-binding domain-containing protein [Bacteroidetes bacterium]|nr:LysM peptidoglycan-binding domain-containing protein [Bacteroidota bacterium]